MFEFWDWVGGRYSLWSAIGLSIALTIGFDNFELLLKGGYETDVHFKTAKFDKNIPVLMAIIGTWYTSFFKAQTEAILLMINTCIDSLLIFSKAIWKATVNMLTATAVRLIIQQGPVIWGEPGTNGQHAFYQLIHQGTLLIPCDFIAPAVSHNPVGDHHVKLLSNFFAQTEAFDERQR
jgi:glucose-6-phosphate isomerase